MRKVNVDTPPTITCVEWCFGYGGNHLGLKRVLPGLRCIAASEIEAYAIANLVSKIEAGLLDPFPIWTDVKTFPCDLFRDLVDIFIASYPCTPFSASGKRKGADDPRHLWPFVRRAVEIIRPRFCFFENVEGHVSLGLREVLTELALLGYRVENSRGEPTWGIFSAAEERAPQGRKRVFILASREGDGLAVANRSGSGENRESSELRPEGVKQSPGNSRHTDESKGQEVPLGVGQADSEESGLQGARLLGRPADRGPLYWPGFVARPGQEQHEWEPRRTIETKRGLGGGVNGRASNVDRLRLLGNGVYPASATNAFVTLMMRLFQ